MITGKISRLANTHGSSWGKLQPDGETRQIFFNLSSLGEGGDFWSLVLEQEVTFEEEPDRTNGTHAVQIKVARPAEAVQP